MYRRSIVAAVPALILLLALGPATAQAQSAAKDLVGTWTLVNVWAVQGDKKSEQFGANPKGQVVFDTLGRFTMVVTRADLPKYAAGSRAKGTPDEHKATVTGSVAYFGTYKVEGSDIIYLIEGSTYPNWVGETQKRGFKLDGDTLIYTNTGPSQAGAATELAWKRVK